MTFPKLLRSSSSQNFLSFNVSSCHSFQKFSYFSTQVNIAPISLIKRKIYLCETPTLVSVGFSLYAKIIVAITWIVTITLAVFSLGSKSKEEKVNRKYMRSFALKLGKSVLRYKRLNIIRVKKP